MREAAAFFGRGPLWPLLPAMVGPPLRLLACFYSGFFYHITMIDIILP